MPNNWNSDPPTNDFGELVAVGWPSWLAAASGEALRGWLPLRGDTFQNLGEASIANTHFFRDFVTASLY